MQDNLNGMRQVAANQWTKKKKIKHTHNCQMSVTGVASRRQWVWLIINTLRIIKSICGGEKNALTGRQEEQTTTGTTTTITGTTNKAEQQC